MRWDPSQYARYADERSRPFFDLTARIGSTEPRRVVDLGCGSGELTATLADRWPGAQVEGLDQSPEMIDQAPAERPNLRFGVRDAAGYDATGVDVLVSNAMLQWLPGHEKLLLSWIDQLAPGGWLAFQVPANFDAPSHALMLELAAEPRWADRLEGVLRHGDAVATPDAYLDLFTRHGHPAEVWQTEYLHVLSGPDPVLEWTRGTGLRPILAALADPAEQREFETRYAERLRAAYPERRYGTVFPFRRTFVVARNTTLD